MAAKQKSQRKTTYLGWRNHGRIIARFALLWCVYNFTLWEGLCACEYIQYLTSLADLDQRIPLAEFFVSFMHRNSWMMIFASLFATIFVWDVMKVTHRIMGPLKRAENVLYALAEGKAIRQIKFRKGDMVDSFEKAFNTFLASRYVSNAEQAGAKSLGGHVANPGTLPAGSPERSDSAELLVERQMTELVHALRSGTGSEELAEVFRSAD